MGYGNDQGRLRYDQESGVPDVWGGDERSGGGEVMSGGVELQLLGAPDVHQGMPDGQDFAGRLSTAIVDPIAVAVAEDFPHLRAIELVEGHSAKVGILHETAGRLLDCPAASATTVSATTPEFRLSIKHDGIRASAGEETLRIPHLGGLTNTINY